jgi:phosphatidate cytidylyltransferase
MTSIPFTSSPNTLTARVLSGISLGALVLGALLVDEWLAPWFPCWLVLSITIIGVASLELAGLLAATSARPSLNSVMGGVMALVVANWMPHLAGYAEGSISPSSSSYDAMEPIEALAWPMLTFVGVLMVSFVVQSVQFERPGKTMATISGTVLAVAYVGLLGSFIVQMRWLDGPYHGIPPLLFLIITAKGADTGAYTVGRLAGRHKLWPSLSPNKTIEGALGGMVTAVAASLLLSLALPRLLSVPTLDVPGAVAFGLVVGAVAQLGDLMESMIKRDCERKDASSAVPGFGGVLDVMDSLLFAAPVAYGLWIAAAP